MKYLRIGKLPFLNIAHNLVTKFYMEKTSRFHLFSFLTFIHAVYYVRNNYITDTYKQKYDILNYANHLL